MRWRRAVVVLAVLILAAGGGLVAAGPRLQHEGYDVPWLPPVTPYTAAVSAPAINQGQLGAIVVRPALKPDLQAVRGTVTGLRGLADLTFSHLDRSWVTLLPVSYNNQPGVYPIELVVTDHRGREHREELSLEVGATQFTTSSQYIQLSAAVNSLRTPAKLAEDAAKTAAAKASPSTVPLWSGPFVIPVDGKVTTEFGHTRYINGVFQGRHSGIDWGGVGTGTPVAAANSGKVVLATMLHASGNTVMIDHGLGLFTSYLHLSAIGVSPGQMVATGDIVGLTGSTGVSTGPHLHFTLWVGDVATNPWPWFERDPLELLLDAAPAGQTGG